MAVLRIAVGTDHAGFKLKERLKLEIESLGHEVFDFGTTSEEPVDYPDIIIPAVEMVARAQADYGVVCGGSGIGESIAANKVAGIRCALIYSEETARLSRQHNDANVASFGGRLTDHEQAARWIRLWLSTPFEGGRHVPRIDKIHAYEETRNVGRS